MTISPASTISFATSAMRRMFSIRQGLLVHGDRSNARVSAAAAIGFAVAARTISRFNASRARSNFTNAGHPAPDRSNTCSYLVDSSGPDLPRQ